MTNPLQFPIMYPDRYDVGGSVLRGPRSIPWEIIEPFNNRAKWNHSQTLRRLSERGGLTPREALAVLTDQGWREVESLDEQDALDQIAEIVRSHSDG